MEGQGRTLQRQLLFEIVERRHHEMPRRRDAGRIRDVFHERLGGVVQRRGRPRVRQRQRIECVDDIDRWYIPVEIPLAEIHEDVVSLGCARAELSKDGAFVEKDMIHRRAGEERREIAGRIVVPVVDRRRRVVGLQHADAQRPRCAGVFGMRIRQWPPCVRHAVSACAAGGVHAPATGRSVTRTRRWQT